MKAILSEEDKLDLYDRLVECDKQSLSLTIRLVELQKKKISIMQSLETLRN